MRNTKLKENRGITLIALVITIIVLIILAAVSIAMLTGNSGIIGNAKSAKSTTIEGQLKEEIGLALQAAKVEGQGIYTKGNIEKELNDIKGVTVAYDDSKKEFTVSRNGAAFIVDENGKIQSANGIGLNKSELKLLPGATEDLTVSYFGSASGTVTWTSSNTTAATVENGKVTTTESSTGTTTITATCGSYTATCNVTIVQKVTSISAAALKVGTTKTKPIAVTTVPAENVEELTFSYQVTSGTSNATVNPTTGEVTGVAVGSASVTITGTRANGETVTTTCSITVEEVIEGTLDILGLSWTDLSTASSQISGGTATQITNGYHYNGKNIVLGDTKSITITNASGVEEIYLAQIIGFNHDTKTEGGTKAGITFQLKDCLKTRAKMNDSSTNAGGWKASKMRDYLNTNTTYNIFDNIEEELKTRIVAVDKKTGFYRSDTWEEADETTSDKLWLLSTYEVYGDNIYSGYFKNSKRESDYLTQYEFYVGDTDNTNKKKTRSGSASYWWLRSPWLMYNSSFYNVYNDGSCNSVGTNGYATIDYDVAFGFSI